MHFTLLVAGALLPGELAEALTQSLETPNLKARLARSTLIAQPASRRTAAHLNWLAKELFGQAAPAPTAPYAYAQLAGSPAPAFVWHADPVHIEVARDHLIVQSLDTDAPTDEESNSLIAVANELASAAHVELVDTGGRWFLLSERDWHIDALPLAVADGAAVQMPGGPDAQLWNRLHNEIQMAWHAHSVNQQREANGARTLNAIWLHGGGRYKPLPPIKFAQVHADAPEWQGAAEAAGARGVSASAGVTNTSLVVVETPWAAKQRQEWGAWLRDITTIDQILRAHPADSIDLILTGDTDRTFALRPLDRYKPWRRWRPLAHAFTE
ncbi:MAG TPA: hypothetical protein VM937_09515 [Burkholderiaceae bacterium]|nr:hypothetical protein [Burkholderiaceae bacterium]